MLRLPPQTQSLALKRSEQRITAPAPQQTVSINDFAALSGLSRQTIWRLTKSGALGSIKVGKKRLIVAESWNALVARGQAAEEALRAPPEPEPAPRRGRGRPRKIR